MKPNLNNVFSPARVQPIGVCSDVATDSHGIEPLAIVGDPQLMWRRLQDYLAQQRGFLQSNRLMITTFEWKRRLAYCVSLTMWNLSCGPGMESLR